MFRCCGCGGIFEYPESLPAHKIYGGEGSCLNVPTCPYCHEDNYEEYWEDEEDDE